MAKKPTITSDLFGKTTADPQQNENENEGKSYPISVYLTKAEKAELEGMAKDAGLSRHALLQFAVRQFMKRYRAGEIKAETETRKVTVLKVQD